jgi:hypothetical protein
MTTEQTKHLCHFCQMELVNYPSPFEAKTYPGVRFIRTGEENPLPMLAHAKCLTAANAGSGCPAPLYKRTR